MRPCEPLEVALGLLPHEREVADAGYDAQDVLRQRQIVLEDLPHERVVQDAQLLQALEVPLAPRLPLICRSDCSFVHRRSLLCPSTSNATVTEQVYGNKCSFLEILVVRERESEWWR